MPQSLSKVEEQKLLVSVPQNLLGDSERGEKMNERNNQLYETAKFYKDKNISVHITFKSGDWINGLIISVNEDFKDRLVLTEERYGEMLILFERIKDDGIIPREPKEEKNDMGN